MIENAACIFYFAQVDNIPTSSSLKLSFSIKQSTSGELIKKHNLHPPNASGVDTSLNNK